MPRDERHTETIPVGALGIIPTVSCQSLGEKVNNYLVQWREQRENEHTGTLAFTGYRRDSYIIDAKTPRFGSDATGLGYSPFARHYWGNHSFIFSSCRY